jgi:hypothetical protein
VEEEVAGIVLQEEMVGLVVVVMVEMVVHFLQLLLAQRVLLLDFLQVVVEAVEMEEQVVLEEQEV